MSQEHCPTCGRPLKAGTKSFGRFPAELFLTAVSCSRDAHVEWKTNRADPKSPTEKKYLTHVVFSDDLRKAGLTTKYARLGDLKLWGLLTQDPNHWHQGIYQLTSLAGEFLSGVALIPKKLHVSGGIVLRASEEKISLKDALGGRWEEVAHWIQDWRKKHGAEDEESGQGRLF